MQEILSLQRNAAKPVAVKGFLLGIVGVLVQLSIAQMVTAVLVMLTQIQLLNIGFALYAIYALAAYVSRTVSGSRYMLGKASLVLQKNLGDVVVATIEIPLESVVAVRPVYVGERLACSYRRVSVVDDSCKRPFAMRAGEGLALVSATLARLAAGDLAKKARGMLVAYTQEGKRCCVIRPNEAFLEAIKRALPDAYGVDERTSENTPVTMMAHALLRAFPQYYGYVKPLVSAERLDGAKREIARQRRARRVKIQKLLNKPEQSKSKQAKQEETEKTNEVQDDTL